MHAIYRAIPTQTFPHHIRDAHTNKPHMLITCTQVEASKPAATATSPAAPLAAPAPKAEPAAPKASAKAEEKPAPEVKQLAPEEKEAQQSNRDTAAKQAYDSVKKAKVCVHSSVGVCVCVCVCVWVCVWSCSVPMGRVCVRTWDFHVRIYAWVLQCRYIRVNVDEMIPDHLDMFTQAYLM